MADAICLFVKRIWFETDAAERTQQVRDLNKAIVSARKIGGIYKDCATIGGPFVIPFSKYLKTFCDLNDVAGLTKAVVERLVECGIPAATLEAARGCIKTINFERSFQRTETKLVAGLLWQRKQLKATMRSNAIMLRQLGYRASGKKITTRSSVQPIDDDK